jgi:hypothetical protein
LKVRLSLTDADGTVYNFNVDRTRALPAGDTVKVRYSVNAMALPEGKYNLKLEVNPDNDQPEQYHFNNTIYKYITIQAPGSAQTLMAASQEK